jgi:hypothetical protein
LPAADGRCDGRTTLTALAQPFVPHGPSAEFDDPAPQLSVVGDDEGPIRRVGSEPHDHIVGAGRSGVVDRDAAGGPEGS